MDFVKRTYQNVAKLKDWYPNDKMVIPVCLKDKCCYSGCMSIATY